MDPERKINATGPSEQPPNVPPATQPADASSRSLTALQRVREYQAEVLLEFDNRVACLGAASAKMAEIGHHLGDAIVALQETAREEAVGPTIVKPVESLVRLNRSWERLEQFTMKLTGPRSGDT
jgi:hypothetical protein